MTQRIATPGALFNDRPFAGDGASLYVSAADTPAIVYRKMRVVGRGRRRGRSGWIKGTGGVFDIAAASVLKTNRVANVASPDTFTDANVWAIPSSMWADPGETVTYYADVRIHADDVENIISNYSTFEFTIDENGDIVANIKGTATLIETEVRAGGVVRFRFRYDPALDGVQPNQFTLSRTAGPSSPADVSIPYVAGGGDDYYLEIDSLALSDASPYTFDIIAEDTITAATLVVIADIQVTADATGPIAPINGSITTK